MRTFPILMTVAICLAIFQPVVANETEEKSPHPGFRPESELAAAFLESVKSAKMAVYPTIIRTVDGTLYSEDSQKQIVSMLNEKRVTVAVAKASTIDPGELKGEGQFALFQNDLKTIAEQLKGFDSDADYSLVMEVLFPPNRPAVFGIHCYVYDRQGENAFSFLLNSHHKLFVDADMTAEDSSEASRAEMMEKATKVGVTALMQQIDFGPLRDRIYEGDPFEALESGSWDFSRSENFCKDEFHKFVFPDGHNAMQIEFYDAEGSLSRTAEYVIEGVEGGVLNTDLVGEERRDDSGNLVSWKLIVNSRAQYCWRRSDGGGRGCTAPFKRCNASNGVPRTRSQVFLEDNS